MGQGCGQPDDCRNGLCASGRCQALPNCTDHATNGDETDVDCGGASCSRCPAELVCLAPTDCASGLCNAGRCAAGPTCADGVRNGDEADRDCGGAVCARCADGSSCGAATECASGLCSGTCLTRPTCTDGVRNGTESGVDCGGAVCARCQVGGACAVPSDCLTSLCSAGLCARPPDCADGLKNGNESDLDCGGPVCARCGVGQHCNVASDCSTSHCETRFLWSDTSWKWSPSAPNGWNTAAFSDASWSSAVSEGTHGSGPPWGASPPMPPQTSAEWIWNYDSRSGGDSNTVYFRKAFTGPASPIELHVAADDNFTAFVDGVMVTSGTIWFTPGVATVSPPAGGASVLAIRVTNNGGAGGLVVDGRVTQPLCAP